MRQGRGNRNFIVFDTVTFGLICVCEQGVVYAVYLLLFCFLWWFALHLAAAGCSYTGTVPVPVARFRLVQYAIQVLKRETRDHAVLMPVGLERCTATTLLALRCRILNTRAEVVFT